MPAGGAAPPGTGRVRRPLSDSPHRAAHRSPLVPPASPPPSLDSPFLDSAYPLSPWRQSKQRGGRGGRGGEPSGSCCRRRRSRARQGDARAAASGQQHQQTPPPAAPPPAPPATPILMPDDPRGAPAPQTPLTLALHPPVAGPPRLWPLGGLRRAANGGGRHTPASKHSCKQTSGDRKPREGSRETPEGDRQITAQRAG